MTETLPHRLGKAFRKRREALGFSQEMLSSIQN